MSASLLGIAFKADIKPVAYKMVMVKLVDAGQDDGSRIFPAIATIARAAGCSDRHTQRVLKAFVDVGLLTVVKEGGRGRHSTTEYLLDVAMLDRLGTSHRVTFENGKGTLIAKGDMESPKPFRVTSEAVKGDTMSPDPLVEPLRERDARGREEEGRKPLSIRPVLEYAAREARFEQFLRPVEQGGYPPEFIDSVETARRAWANVDESEWEAAIEAVPRFLRARQRSKRGPVGLIVYIREARWKDFPAPKSVDGRTLDTTIRIEAFGRSAWVLFARRYAAGKSVRDQLHWIRNGAEIPAAVEPTEAEEAALKPVMIGSEQHVAWRDHCKRLGFDLPMPSLDVPIFMPGEFPPQLSLSWKAYPLIEEVGITIRGPAWWWRVYQPKAPVADMMADRSSGTVRVSMGPLPLPAEVDDMVEIKYGDREVDDWDLWFRRMGCRDGLFLLGLPIWAPSRKPPAMHEPATIDDYTAVFEAIGGK